MEKKKTKKLIMSILLGFYLLVFVGLLAVQNWAGFLKLGFSMESYIYWWILVGFLAFVLNFKWKSEVFFGFAFGLFIIAALLASVTLRSAGETVMRISFIGWLVGIGKALIEYRNGKK